MRIPKGQFWVAAAGLPMLPGKLPKSNSGRVEAGAIGFQANKELKLPCVKGMQTNHNIPNISQRSFCKNGYWQK